MWLVTKDGFFSAVEHREHRDCVLVRARVRADLERAFPGMTVEVMEKADYPYRILIGKGAWAAYCAAAAVGVDYPNFKAAITDQRRHNVYLSVWAVLRRLSAPRRGVGVTVDQFEQPILWIEEDQAAAAEQADCDWCGHPFEQHYLLNDEDDAGCSACPDRICTESQSHHVHVTDDGFTGGDHCG